MSLHRTFAAVALLSASLLCHAAEGLTSVKSALGAKATMDRLEGIVKQRGLTVFARIDHAAGAKKIGKSLRPTAQSVGIDLPLKALVWEDASGQVWLGYNDPAYLAKRHEVPDCEVATKLGKALTGIAAEAVAK